jgi:hypothetical protein
MWAVLLGLLLALVAATSSHATTIAPTGGSHAAPVASLVAANR